MRRRSEALVLALVPSLAEKALAVSTEVPEQKQ
jgi:hypothetical protein